MSRIRQCVPEGIERAKNVQVSSRGNSDGVLSVRSMNSHTIKGA
jgi:hypothetical protein